MHFVPRVNLAAMYEILGVNVVDTFPHSIANVFRRPHNDPSRVVVPAGHESFDLVRGFDSEMAFAPRIPNKSSSSPAIRPTLCFQRRADGSDPIHAGPGGVSPPEEAGTKRGSACTKNVRSPAPWCWNEGWHIAPEKPRRRSHGVRRCSRPKLSPGLVRTTILGHPYPPMTC